MKRKALPNTVKINSFLSRLLQLLELLKLLMRLMCKLRIPVQLTLMIRICRTWQMLLNKQKHVKLGMSLDNQDEAQCFYICEGPYQARSSPPNSLNVNLYFKHHQMGDNLLQYCMIIYVEGNLAGKSFFH